MKNEGISIILCCYNSSLLLPETLRHIANLAQPPDVAMEIIVVDNASDDNSIRVAQHIWEGCNSPFPAFFIHEPRPGLIFARQSGIKHSRYPYLLFVDDDNHLFEDYAIELLSVFRRFPNAGAIGGFNTPLFRSEKPAWYNKFQFFFATGTLADGFGEPKEIGLFGAGLSIRKKALDGLYNNGFKSKLIGRQGALLTSGEDYELCKALKIAGWDIFFVPEMRLNHLILPKRLNWEYLRNLNDGISRSIPIFLAYEYWIEMGNKALRPITKVKYSWLFMLIRKWLKLMLVWFDMRMTAGGKHEGSELLINFERSKIVAFQFLIKRKEFTSLKREIGKSAWRKKN